MAGPERVDNMTRNGNLARWIAVLLGVGTILVSTVVWSYSTFVNKTDHDALVDVRVEAIEQRFDAIEQRLDRIERLLYDINKEVRKP